MKKLVIFLIKLIKSSQENDLFAAANELTYRLLLALFPFIIFLMSLVGFFNLNAAHIMNELRGVLPDSVYSLINVFVEEVILVKNAGILSVSLIITIYSSSSGFNAMIRAINKAYGQKETRGWIRVRATSILLVIIFAFTIIISIASLIFGDSIYRFLDKIFDISPLGAFFFSFAAYLLIMVILLISIILIYRLAGCRKVSIYNLIPGAVTTLLVWIIASKIFNIYINNFAKFSRIYGSLASVFIMMFWLNIISIILVLGAKINALLESHIE